MNTEIFLAHLNDYKEIFNLINLSAKNLQKYHYSDKDIEIALQLVNGFDKLIESRTFYKLTLDKKIVACGGYKLIDDKVAELKTFFVHPKYARQGLASKLLNKCISECTKKNIIMLKLVATLTGKPLYEKFGFIPQEEELFPLINGSKFKLIHMHKTLF